MTGRKLTWEEWMEQVHQKIVHDTGLDHYDFPDVAYRDWYDDGLTVSQAAKRAVKEWKEF